MMNLILYLNWSLLIEEMNKVLVELPDECQQAVREIDDFQRQVILHTIRRLRQLYVIKITDFSHESIISSEQHQEIRQLMRQGIYETLKPEQREKFGNCCTNGDGCANKPIKF